MDARKVVLSEADLGPKWVRDVASEPTGLDAHHASSSFRWDDPSGRPSPGGLAAISSRVVVHPDGAAARAELKPLPPDCQPIGAPSVGESSRACTRSVAPDSRAVYLEAVEGNVWLQVGVTGSPRSEMKITSAAELARTMLSRLAIPGTLTVEEYPIADRSVDSPGRLEYSRRIDQRILEKRKAWRVPDPEARLAATNRSLAPFGYRLAANERSNHPTPLYNLYRGETLILRDLAHMGPVSVSARGDDFAMVVETRQSGEFLIRPSGVEKWSSMEHAFTRPVFVDDDLVTVEMGPQGRQYSVLRGIETVHRFEAEFIVDNPVKGLWSWDDHWVLEIDGKLLVDGRSLNEEVGYEEVFGWRLLAGRPFYFFKRGGRIGVSYAGEVLPHRYDEVIHYKCCEPAAFNVAGNEAMVWFHGLRDGTWHYVEMGVYERAAEPGAATGAEAPSPPTPAPTQPGPGMHLSEGTPAVSTGSLEQARNEVSWQDGQVMMRIRGDLSVDELLKVAQSLY